ncbi:hypothetical protein [Pseudodesulfovibrio portus]|nr:hypothetical protein [Pseudodesulfovibrio portus]
MKKFILVFIALIAWLHTPPSFAQVETAIKIAYADKAPPYSWKTNTEK